MPMVPSWSAGSSSCDVGLIEHVLSFNGSGRERCAQGTLEPFTMASMVRAVSGNGSVVKRGSRVGSMSDEHKRALAQGREESRAVRAYLEALEAQGPRK